MQEKVASINNREAVSPAEREVDSADLR